MNHLGPSILQELHFFKNEEESRVVNSICYVRLIVFYDFCASAKLNEACFKTSLIKNALNATEVLSIKGKQAGAASMGTTKCTFWPPGGIID